MRHHREEVIGRAIREFELLDRLAMSLSAEDWQKPVPRPETKEPWTVKDAFAHIVYWKSDVIRSCRGERRPPEMRGLNIGAGNHLVYLRWRDRPVEEILAWHRQVQADLLAALREAPEEWFSGKERDAGWPGDLDGHSAYHRVRDIEQAVGK